jgi:hypothetical protein
MAVVVDSGPVTATLKLRQVPQEKWLDLMWVRRDFMQRRLGYDCRCLVEFIADAEIMYGPLGYESADNMIRDGYDLSPEEIRVAVEWLKLNPPDEPISLPAVQEWVAAEWGGAREGAGRPKAGEQREGNQADNISLNKPEYGTSAAYTLARLNRDRPDLAEKVRAKELSPNAAAIEAGFRKRVIQVPDGMEAAATTLIKRWGAEKAVQFAKLILDLTGAKQ